MKRFFITIATVLAAHTSLNAQNAFDDIIINDAEINRNDQVMTVNMDLDFQDLNFHPTEPCFLHLI